MTKDIKKLIRNGKDARQDATSLVDKAKQAKSEGEYTKHQKKLKKKYPHLKI
jgi:hypothetical protein